MKEALNIVPLGEAFTCKCGKTHHILPKEIIYAEDALEQLPTACSRLTGASRVALIMDVRTRTVAGAKAAAEFSRAGWAVSELVVQDPPENRWPICDDITKEKLESSLGMVDLIVPVGSGVLNDLGKWLAFERNIPFIPFATAASMNGYTSANTAPTIRGMKSLAFARPPIGVISSPTVLCEAPYELTMAGLGDVLAKTVSTTDWFLNHLLFGDHYCEKSAGLITNIEPLYLNHPEELRSRSAEAIGALFHALLLTGISMTMAETSAPASGGEHMISHTLDMLSSVDQQQHDLHGRQVGVATILAADLYQRVMSIESPRFVDPTESIDAQFWGPLADVVAENYVKKIDKLWAAKEKLSTGDTWDKLRQKLSVMPHAPETLHNCLARAGAATRAEDILCDHKRLADVFLHAHEIRPRFTILDLARLVGILPEQTEEIVKKWA